MLDKILETIIANSPYAALFAYLLVTHWDDLKTMIRDVLSAQIEAKRQRDKMQASIDDLKRRTGLIEAEITGERSPTLPRPPQPTLTESGK